MLHVCTNMRIQIFIINPNTKIISKNIVMPLFSLFSFEKCIYLVQYTFLTCYAMGLLCLNSLINALIFSYNF